MSDLNFNTELFNLTRENELADILSHYNSEYVFSVVQDALQRKYTVNVVAIPNVVNAWEQNFKAIINQYGPSVVQEVSRVRNETYREIINIICKEFKLNFTVADVDIFSAAYKIYQLFVCDFNNFIVSFLSKYIYKERNSIYESMGLSELKKNKDSGNIYSKKVFKDQKLAIINSYIDTVISNLSEIDFDLYSIINYAISSKELSQYYINLISATGDFFRESIMPILNSSIRPIIITNIRFKLFDIASSHDQIIQPGITDIAISANTENNMEDMIDGN